MGLISSRNYQGGLETKMSPSSSGGSFSPAGGMDVGSLWRAMTRRKRTPEEGGYANFTPGELSGGDDYYTRNAKANALQRDNAETAALTQPAPTRVITVGQQSFVTQAPDQYTGAQRKAFLPNNATEQPDARAAYRAMLESKDEEDLYSPEARRRTAAKGAETKSMS